MAGDRHHGQRRDNGRHGEHDRDARRNQGAEHHQQQHQRDRYRGRFRLAEVQGVVDRPGNARVTGLGDEQIRMAGLHGGDRALVGRHSLIPVLGAAGDDERDQGAAPVRRHQGPAAGTRGTRGQRRLDVRGGRGQGGQGGGHLADGLAQARVAGHGVAGRPRLDQHLLGARAVVVRRGLVQGAFGLAGLARIVAGQVLAAQRLGGHEQHGDQREPAEHRRLPVPGAPPGDPLDDRPAVRRGIRPGCGGARTPPA